MDPRRLTRPDIEPSHARVFSPLRLRAEQVKCQKGGGDVAVTNVSLSGAVVTVMSQPARHESRSRGCAASGGGLPPAFRRRLRRAEQFALGAQPVLHVRTTLI